MRRKDRVDDCIVSEEIICPGCGSDEVADLDVARHYESYPELMMVPGMSRLRTCLTCQVEWTDLYLTDSGPYIGLALGGRQMLIPPRHWGPGGDEP